MSYPFDCITEFMFFESIIEPADVIMIPGGSHPQLMEKAAELFHQGFAPYILPSGGSTRHVNTTEWEYLRNIGVELGVPKNSILREDKATNTFENASFSLRVLQQKGIHFQKVILVCKSYHARRALLTYQTVFNDIIFLVCPITDKTGTTKDNWFLDDKRISYVMNELTKVGQYFAHHIPNWVERSHNGEL